MSSGTALRLGAKGADAKAVCVLVHGRGQSPEEMQSHVLARLAVPEIAFVLPRGPRGAWYEARAIDPLTSAARDHLAESLAHIAADIAAARDELPGRPLLLAGFSQGACLSIEYCFAALPLPDALAAFTGCRVGAPSDIRADVAPAGLPVYLSGSDADPWIPVSAFAEAAHALGLAGARLRADVFPGRGHEVSDAEITMLSAMLADLASGGQSRMEAPR